MNWCFNAIFIFFFFNLYFNDTPFQVGTPERKPDEKADGSTTRTSLENESPEDEVSKTSHASTCSALANMKESGKGSFWTSTVPKTQSTRDVTYFASF